MEITRQAIAYGIIAAVVLLIAPVLITGTRRRRRLKLRRKGIKTYGH